MGTESLSIANTILYYAPWCLLAAGVTALLIVIVRYLVNSDKESRAGETIDRSTRVVGFVGSIAVIAVSAVAGVKSFVSNNPGQSSIEAGSSSTMIPTNDWWKPSGIGSNDVEHIGGTEHTDEVIDELQKAADQANEEGDSERAENYENRIESISGTNRMVNGVQKFLGGCAILSPICLLARPIGDFFKNINSDFNGLGTSNPDAKTKETTKENARRLRQKNSKRDYRRG